MSDANVRVTLVEGAAVLTIDREEQKNSLSRDTIRALGEQARWAAKEPTVRAVILTGKGNKVFCAGADLKERRGMDNEDVRKQLQLYRDELSALDRCPKPVIAAINGIALGGGLELALLCDLRVCASHAEMGLPETGLGIIPGAGGTQRIGRIVGEGRAKEMVLLGRRVNAEVALAWGLVNRVANPNADLIRDVLDWIAPILRGAPIAQSAALDAIDGSFDRTLVDGLALEVACYERTLVSEDRNEALAAFAEKRAPIFVGR